MDEAPVRSQDPVDVKVLDLVRAFGHVNAVPRHELLVDLADAVLGQPGLPAGQGQDHLVDADGLAVGLLLGHAPHSRQDPVLLGVGHAPLPLALVLENEVPLHSVVLGVGLHPAGGRVVPQEGLVGVDVHHLQGVRDRFEGRHEVLLAEVEQLLGDAPLGEGAPRQLTQNLLHPPPGLLVPGFLAWVQLWLSERLGEVGPRVLDLVVLVLPSRHDQLAGLRPVALHQLNPYFVG